MSFLVLLHLSLRNIMSTKHLWFNHTHSQISVFSFMIMILTSSLPNTTDFFLLFLIDNIFLTLTKTNIYISQIGKILSIGKEDLRYSSFARQCISYFGFYILERNLITFWQENILHFLERENSRWRDLGQILKRVALQVWISYSS